MSLLEHVRFLHSAMEVLDQWKRLGVEKGGGRGLHQQSFAGPVTGTDSWARNRSEMEVGDQMRSGVTGRSKLWQFVLVGMIERPAQPEGLLCHHSTWFPRA